MGAEATGGDLWALDFDGVVCNSVGESSQSAWEVGYMVYTVSTAMCAISGQILCIVSTCFHTGIGAEVARALCAARDAGQGGRDTS